MKLINENLVCNIKYFTAYLVLEVIYLIEIDILVIGLVKRYGLTDLLIILLCKGYSFSLR